MMMLLAIFFPPGYFFAAGRPVAGVVHLVVWVISILLLFAFLLGIFVYFIQAALAMWDLRRVIQLEQATAIADKMAERMTFTRTDGRA
jgi:hypothetical protein